jgi:hypothetical protein
MFGYIIPNQRELKVRELEEYKGWYCGLCHCLQQEYGLGGRISLNYDMTFLSLLLSALYDGSFTKRFCVCPVHPLQKHLRFDGIYVEYAAAMNVLLTYYKCMDDWRDDHDLIRGGYGVSLKRSVKKVYAGYPAQSQAVRQYLRQLQSAETKKVRDLDTVSGIFGRLCGDIFALEKDIWYDDMWHLGFYLGKYIYLLDAWDDLEEDYRSGSYNPLLFFVGEQEQDIRSCLEQRVSKILTGMMGEACHYFEKLPIVEYGGILRNILYSGVWTRFYKISGGKSSRRTGKRAGEK